MRAEILERVKAVYDHHFTLFSIDPETGELPSRDRKFATYPYIGSKYSESSRTKLLIVGLDIGGDETPGRIQSIEERQQQIENRDPAKHNPHIAGTYMTALYYMRRHSPKWSAYWNQLDDQATCKQLLKRKTELPLENPLSYIALTNYHKFVTELRKHRRGAKDRGFKVKLLGQFLTAEVRALSPDIVILQSKSFTGPYQQPMNRIAEHCRLLIGPHPTAGHVRNPQALIREIGSW